MSQLKLFKISSEELEQKALLSATLTREIIDLEDMLKDSRAKLRESSDYLLVKEVRAHIKDAKDRLGRVHAELRAAAKDL